MPHKDHPSSWYLGRLDLLRQFLPLADDFHGIDKWQKVVADETVKCVEALGEQGELNMPKGVPPYVGQQCQYVMTDNGVTWNNPCVITKVNGPIQEVNGVSTDGDLWSVDCWFVLSQDYDAFHPGDSIYTRNKPYQGRTEKTWEIPPGPPW
jgi:hypothetical protein